MRQIKISVYSFSELSDAAKEVAIENYRRNLQNWGDNPFEDFDEGLDFSERGFSKIETRVGVYGAGSGVSFNSEVDLSKFVPDRVKNNPSLLRLLRNNVTVTTEKNVSNSYSYPSESDVKMSDDIGYYHPYPRIWEFLDTMLENIQQEYMSICKELYKGAEADYEWFFSDEKITEDIQAKEYEFLANGERFELEHLIEDDDEGEDEEERITCDCCVPMMIQGFFCHETGCLNMGKVWEDGEWVEQEIERDNDEYCTDEN